jgi:hypothetical protein
MTDRFYACAHKHAHDFIRTQAILGYPNRYAKEPALAERRRGFVDFSRKLHGALAPLLGECCSLHEELTLLTSSGFAGRTIRADCVVLTNFGVFVITRVQWSGRVSVGADMDNLRVETEPGKTEAHPCPLTYAAPTVHVLSALLAQFRRPIEAVAIVDHEMSELGRGVPTSLLKLGDLHHFLRVKREDACDKFYHLDLRAMGERLRTGCRLVAGATAAQFGGWPTIEPEG